MRILHAIHDFLPRHQAGSEIYALTLCRELAARHHVTVLCADRDPEREHGHVTWRVYDGLPIVEITNNWRCSSFAETYNSPRVSDQIAHILRAVQPDVIHVHSLQNLSFELTAFARERDVPIVSTLHDYTLVCPSGGQRIHRDDHHICEVIDAERCARCFRESPDFALMSFGRLTSFTQKSSVLRRPAAALARTFPVLMRQAVNVSRHAPLFAVDAPDIERRLEAARRVFDDVDLFIAPSSFMAAEFQRLGICASKIRVSDYGMEQFRATPRIQRSGPLRVGYVGTLVWHKGVHVLLDALRSLPSDTYEAKIFGSFSASPEYAASLQHQAEGLPVRFMGPFERRDLADIYADLDVLVVPSLWLENSPLVIHEAFIAGVPVVGARIGGITELIAHGRNGLLYEPALPSDLARVLGDLAIDEAGVRRLAEGARETRLKSIAEDAAACERIYDDLCRLRGGEGEGRTA